MPTPYDPISTDNDDKHKRTPQMSNQFRDCPEFISDV